MTDIINLMTKQDLEDRRFFSGTEYDLACTVKVMYITLLCHNFKSNEWMYRQTANLDFAVISEEYLAGIIVRDLDQLLDFIQTSIIPERLSKVESIRNKTRTASFIRGVIYYLKGMYSQSNT